MLKAEEYCKCDDFGVWEKEKRRNFIQSLPYANSPEISALQFAVDEVSDPAATRPQLVNTFTISCLKRQVEGSLLSWERGEDALPAAGLSKVPEGAMLQRCRWKAVLICHSVYTRSRTGRASLTSLPSFLRDRQPFSPFFRVASVNECT